MEHNITTTNNCEMFWEVTQPSRGVFAFRGFLNIKEDINTNNAVCGLSIYYSKNGISYTLTPFHIPPTTVLTEYINVAYTQYMKDTVTECCENAIDYKDKFSSPLTKRQMICKDCILLGDNFPSHLKAGYYRVISFSEGEFVYVLALTIKVENK